MMYRGFEIKKEVVQHTGRERYRIYKGGGQIGSEEKEELALDTVDRIIAAQSERRA